MHIRSEDFSGLSVALVHLWAQPYVDNRASGLVYGFENLGNDLQKVGFNVDHLFFSNKKKDGEWHPLFSQVQIDQAEILNRYDFLIFGSAGSGSDKKQGAWWKSILDAVKVPFAVQINNEVDQQVLTYKSYFYDNPNFSLLLPITEGLAHTATPKMDESRVLVYECLPRTGLTDPEMFYGQKTDQIVTTCRITTRKRVLELVQQAQSLHNAGFATDIHGADATWRYVGSLRELSSEYWNFHGSFRRDQLSEILAPAKFHYNACYLKREVLTPRIETSTVEAASFGCCSILSRSTAPEWVTDDMAILVDTNDLSDLARRLSSARHKAHEMNARFWEAYKQNIGQDKLHLLAERIFAIIVHWQDPH